MKYNGAKTISNNFWEDLKKNIYSYIIVAIVSGLGSVLAFVGATGGAILALPDKVDANEIKTAKIEEALLVLQQSQERQNNINEKQELINEGIDKSLISIDNKLNILIQK